MEVVDERGRQSEIERLTEELWAIRARHGRGTSHGEQAFHRLVAAYTAAGRRIDELSSYEPDETTRFFNYTLQGDNGHVYWHSGHSFAMNNGKTRKPVLWWWNHLYGVKPDQVAMTCGQSRCINPRHAVVASKGPKRIYPDHAILGALQVWALHHGHSPSILTWDGSPTHTVIKHRFGSWTKALKAAGLKAVPPNQPHSPEQNLEAVRYVHSLLGRWPSHNDYLSFREELRARGFSTAPSTIRRHFGVWADVIEAAKRP